MYSKVSLMTFQINYDSEGSGFIQMRFLRLLSTGARQNFTYTCVKTVAPQRYTLVKKIFKCFLIIKFM